MLDKFQQIESSLVDHNGTTYSLIKLPDTGEKRLAVIGNTSGFVGTLDDGALICGLTPHNAKMLRERLPWLRPVALGRRMSAGFGDRLGIATLGHVLAVQPTDVAPIFAQQSVRENARTGRSPQQVIDDAMWGVFQAGWRGDWGADADHLKHISDIANFVAAGYTFYTIDPGDHVDDTAEHDDLATLREKVARLAWADLHSDPTATQATYQRAFDLDDRRLIFDELSLLRALAKYGNAVAHTVRMAEAIQAQMGNRPFDLEMSVDETGTTTSLLEHFYIASELKRLNVSFVSLAPRFVGRFEKGVDYIGNLEELDANIAGHAAILRYFGNSYKLSLHTGSDKFGIYPIAVNHTNGLVHLKTAGTSYLEALRLLASVDPTLFREILTLARDRYEMDRKTYHVSASLDKVPAAATLADTELVGLLNQFDARQVLHVTYGSALDQFGVALHTMLKSHESDYHQYIKTHFDKHLAAFKTKINIA